MTNRRIFRRLVEKQTSREKKKQNKTAKKKRNKEKKKKRNEMKRGETKINEHKPM